MWLIVCMEFTLTDLIVETEFCGLGFQPKKKLKLNHKKQTRMVFNPKG